MSKGGFIILFIALIGIMIGDVVYQFSDTVKKVIYGTCLVLGIGIYLYHSDINLPKKKGSENESK